MMSLPRLPYSQSLPFSPLRVLAALLPVILSLPSVPLYGEMVELLVTDVLLSVAASLPLLSWMA